MTESTGGLLTNLRRGVIEYCVLAALHDDAAYVYQLERLMSRQGIIAGPESSLYPVMARLLGMGRVSASWRTSPSGPPRKYYRITQSGSDALDEFKIVWPLFSEVVSNIMKGDHHEENQPTTD